VKLCIFIQRPRYAARAHPKIYGILQALARPSETSLVSFDGSVSTDAIKRFNALKIIPAAVLLNFFPEAINLSGVTIAYFWLCMVALDVGWIFVWIGGASPLRETYEPHAKQPVQDVNDRLVFATTAISPSSAGFLVNARGAEMVNYTAISAIAICVHRGDWIDHQRPSKCCRVEMN
jgi:hypothetical protein